MRTLVADVTLTQQAKGDELLIGLRWRSGASELIVTRRPPPLYETKRTPNPAAELIGQLGPYTSDQELVAQLNTRGVKTGMGRPFDVAAVKWVRYIRRVPAPSGFQPGELSVDQVAARVGISANAVYYWIERGHLAARRTTSGRLCVAFTPEVEAACQKRVADSPHLSTGFRKVPARKAV